MTVAGPNGLPWLLFRLAGRVADDGLAAMRTYMADGDTGDAVRLLGDALIAGRPPLSTVEAAAAGAALYEHGGEPTLVARMPRLVEPDALPYVFSSPDAADPAAEQIDAAAVAASAAAGGLRGLWRVSRSGSGATVTVRLAEAVASADLGELTADMQYGIAQAGEVPPRVEAFTEEMESTVFTPYHDAALAAAALVWTAPAAPVPVLARAFDGVDPDRGPFFAADHPRIEGAQQQRLLAYFGAGETVLTGFEPLDDIVEPVRTRMVPAGFRSDGHWVWNDTATYYLDRYGLAPDPSLQAHALAAEGPPSRLSRLTRRRVLEALTSSRPDEEPVWRSA